MNMGRLVQQRHEHAQKQRDVSRGAKEKEFLLGWLDSWTSSWKSARRLNNTLSTFSPGGLAGRLAQECELKARGAATGCSRYFLLTLMTADLLVLVPIRILFHGSLKKTPKKSKLGCKRMLVHDRISQEAKIHSFLSTGESRSG